MEGLFLFYCKVILFPAWLDYVSLVSRLSQNTLERNDYGTFQNKIEGRSDPMITLSRCDVAIVHLVAASYIK